MVWKTIGAERRRINSWSPIATERGSRSYYQNLTVIHFPLLARSIQGPPSSSSFLLFLSFFSSSSSSPAMPTTWTLLSGLHGRFGQTLFPSAALRCEGDNGARQTSARRARVPLPSMRFASAAPKWKSAFSPPLRSKWSLPSALLRMLKRHPSRNCTWDGGGCDWIWRRGWWWWWGEKTRNVHIIIITYLTVMQPHQKIK